jgi:hypothetical protein
MKTNVRATRGCTALTPVWSRAPLRACRFPSVLLSVVFGRFLSVVGCVVSMTGRDFRMVRGLFMIAGFVMLGRLQMVSCCELVMFSRFLVVFSAFMSCHVLCSSLCEISVLPFHLKYYPNDSSRLR